MIQRIATFFILAVQTLLAGYEIFATYDTHGKQNALALTNVGAVAIFLIVQRVLRRRYGITIHWVVLLVIAGSIWLDAMGNFLHYYGRFWWWDRLTHAVGGLALTVGFYVVCYSLWRSGRLKVSWFVLNLYAFSLSQLVGMVYEVSEWVGDALFKTGRIGGLYDTPRDLFFNIVGGLVVLAVGALWHSRQRGVRGDGEGR